MHLDYAMFAERADFLKDDRLLLIGAGIDTLHVESIPAQISLYLIARIASDEGDPLEGHEVSLELVNPQGEALRVGGMSNLQLGPSSADSHVMPSAVVVIRLNLGLKSYGVYRFHFSINGTEVKVLPVAIREMVNQSGGSNAAN